MIELIPRIEYAPWSENEMSYEEAVLYCRFCIHDGYTNWRIPTFNEYRAIIDRTNLVYSWNTQSSNITNRARKSKVIPVRDKIAG